MTSTGKWTEGLGFVVGICQAALFPSRASLETSSLGPLTVLLAQSFLSPEVPTLLPAATVSCVLS